MTKRTKTGGRQLGTPNKITSEVKEALTQAFDEMGGVPALVAWAKKRPNAFYALWVRLLPLQAKVEHSGRMTLEQLLTTAKENDISYPLQVVTGIPEG